MADPLILILPFQSRSMHSAKTGSFVEKCMDLKTVIQSEVSQKEKN